MLRPSLSSVSGFGNERPSRLPIPAARITICVLTIGLLAFASAANCQEFT
jgi:hypothetical protein